MFRRLQVARGCCHRATASITEATIGRSQTLVRRGYPSSRHRSTEILKFPLKFVFCQGIYPLRCRGGPSGRNSGLRAEAPDICANSWRSGRIERQATVIVYAHASYPHEASGAPANRYTSISSSLNVLDLEWSTKQNTKTYMSPAAMPGAYTPPAAPKLPT